MNKTYLLVSLLIVIILLVGCKPQNINEENKNNTSNEQDIYPLTITDKFKNKITINQTPTKVISFSPELVEIMYALDLEDQLIGRSIYCDYPEETISIPDMGDLFNLNIELMVETNPDLILLSSMAEEEVVKTLQEQGLTVLVLDSDTSVDGTYEYIQTIGRIFNKEESANNLINNMKQDIENIYDKTKKLEKPTAYFIIGYGEYDSTATGDTFIGELIEIAGAENAAADGSNWMYSIEQLIEKDPNILICSKYFDSKNQIMNLEGYKELTAVKEGRLYEVDENIFYRQGPRMVEAIELLAKLFHPEVFIEN